MRNVLAQRFSVTITTSNPGSLSLLCLVIESKLKEREIRIEVVAVSILKGNEPCYI